MSHPTDEQLLTLHWEGTRATARHAAACAECAGRLADLRLFLKSIESAPVPERSADYGREVWSRLAPRLPARGPSRPFQISFARWRPFALAASFAAVAIAAFLAGRLASSRASAARAAGRDRVLLVAVGEHLERSEAVLLELVHGAGEGQDEDVSAEQARLSDLLPANRLFRQAASRTGEPAVSGVLDELERLLLDVRHGPSRLSAAERAALVRRIETDGVLFKLRVLGARLRDRAETPPETLPERKRV